MLRQAGKQEREHRMMRVLSIAKSEGGITWEAVSARFDMTPVNAQQLLQRLMAAGKLKRVALGEYECLEAPAK